MELTHWSGRTYLILDSTVIGVYVFPDETCLLFDSAATKRSARQVQELLQRQGLKIIGIMNTHAHSDHIAGNYYLQQQSGCFIYARPQESVFIAHPKLQIQMIYGARPPRQVQRVFAMPEGSLVTHFLVPGPLEIKGEVFEVLDLAGHTAEHCGFSTPDGLIFAGDAVIDTNILAEYPFIYCADVEAYLRSLELLRDLRKPVLTAHGGCIDELGACLDENRALIERVNNFYITLLEMRPVMSREELVQESIKAFGIHKDLSKYYMTLSTVSAYLSYLCEQGVIRLLLQEGTVRFKKSQV